MANSRIMLVCKHCGRELVLGKGYYGAYHTASENKSVELNKFFEHHQSGMCSDDPDCSDNARNHFVLLEEGETLATLEEEANKAKSEAIKGFVERLKEKKYQSSDWSHGEHPFVVEEDDIDNLVEEMVGEDK